MSGATLVVKLKLIFDKFLITQKILAYTKDEGSNFANLCSSFQIRDVMW